MFGFSRKDAEHAASPATMRHVRCIPNGTKVPKTGHIGMRTWEAREQIHDLITVNGVRVTLADGTWGLVRAPNKL